MGQDHCCHLLSEKGKKVSYCTIQGVSEGLQELYFQGSLCLLEQNCQETIILLPQFATQWAVVNAK